MQSRECLRIAYIYRLSRFEVENDLVLGAVILEHAPDVLPTRDHVQKSEKDSHTNAAVNHVEGDSSMKGGETLFEQRGQVQRNEFIQEDKETEGEKQVQRHHPGRNFLRFSLLRLGFGRVLIERRVGGKLQCLHAKPHRLSESSNAAQDGIFEERIFFGNAR